MKFGIFSLSVVLAGVVSTAAGQPAPRTIWQGVYTEAQAARGEKAYKLACGYCHKDNLAGGFFDDGNGRAPALAGPFPDTVFCPTGGITRQTAPEYLALANVACVGGSWVAPPSRVEAGDWDAIEALAREAAALRPAR